MQPLDWTNKKPSTSFHRMIMDLSSFHNNQTEASLLMYSNFLSNHSLYLFKSEKELLDQSRALLCINQQIPFLGLIYTDWLCLWILNGKFMQSIFCKLPIYNRNLYWVFYYMQVGCTCYLFKCILTFFDGHGSPWCCKPVAYNKDKMQEFGKLL